MSHWGEPVFSDFLLGGYLGLISLMWLGLLFGVSSWGRRWTLQSGGQAPGGDAPRVSVCIPARDEALNIGACVTAALALRWPNLEVVVVDDRSSDGTGDIALAAGAGDARLRVVQGTERPAGWAGKAWACARASGEASGDMLLFLDADVRIHPDALIALMEAMQSRSLALGSVFGTWDLRSFWERALIPTVGWLIRGAVDLDAVNAPGRPEAFANGQLILVRRADYDALDGHAAIKDQILDDVRLAEAFKRRGHPIGMFVGRWMFHVRLYRTLDEIIQGYTKNLYEGMGRRPMLGLGAVLFIFVGTLLPFLGLAGGLLARLGLGWGVPEWPWLAWTAVICLVQIAFRWRVERRDGRSGRIAWAHPIANMLLVWILLRSVIGVEASWKGRTFVDGRAS